MSAYLDTSFIVAALTPEVKSPEVLAWLEEQNSAHLSVSDWTIVEVASALSLKLRTGQITSMERSEAMRAFRQFQRESTELIAVSGLDFLTATRFVERHELKLRAGDALHLAIALQTGAHVYTLDARMAAAGPALSVSTTLIA